MIISIITDICIIVSFALVLLGSVGLAIYSVKKGEPVLPEEKTNEKLDEIIDILHCIASDKLDSEAMKEIHKNENNNQTE